MIDFTTQTIFDLHDALMRGDITVAQLVAHAQKTATDTNNLNIYLEVFSGPDIDKRITQAQEMIDNKTAHVLTGIPYAVKDNILVKGYISSASSKILGNYTASYSATVIEKLDAVGAIPMGRTNMDEFAMGSSTENSAYGRTKNPIDPARSPGGSSGGPAAAVAAGTCVFSLGSDTGGSIRQPAAFCGITGIYPTYGSVSRYGAIALASSLDQIGPFTKTAREAETILQVIAGADHYDNQSHTISTENKKPAVIGVPWKFLDMPGVDPQTVENFKQTIESLKSAGYTVRDIQLPHAHVGLSAYYIIQPAEASSNLARYDGIRYGVRSDDTGLQGVYDNSRSDGFGPETKRRIMLGTYILSAGYYDAYYTKAQKVRTLIRLDYDQVFASGVDVIMTPTTPSAAFISGSKTDPLSMYMEDIFAVGANLSQIPAISVPCGHDSNNMPFGIQVFAPAGAENRLFDMGEVIEKLGK
jgi:aspartyl-tRNA(Asn)/glutamyl-tRNA(Gln) amidotransferase subunit A